MLMPTPAPTAPPGRSSKLAWWIAGIAVLGAAGTVVGVVATRNDGTTHAAATTQDAGVAAAPVTPDAALAVPAAAIDAGVVVARPVDASAPDAPPDAQPVVPPVVPIDAPIDAPSKRPHHPPHTPVPHAGSATTTQPGCDRTIDTDCDGIPDVR
jgi:hypothetical protein